MNDEEFEKVSIRALKNSYLDDDILTIVTHCKQLRRELYKMIDNTDGWDQAWEVFNYVPGVD